MATNGHPLDRHMMEAAGHLQQSLQDRLPNENFLIREVTKEGWPENAGTALPIFFTSGSKEYAALGNKNEAVIIGESKLQNAAINSAHICLDDLRKDEHVAGVLKNVFISFLRNLEHLWGKAFERDIIRNTRNKRVQRSVGVADPGEQLAILGFPEAVSFTGRPVNPFVVQGGRKCINPKYKRAAKRHIFFNRDTVHFLFPNITRWVGKVMWINMPDRECNPDGHIGYFRVVTRYAAMPTRTDLGRVVTVPPKGVIGFFWYLAWKLVRFNP